MSTTERVRPDAARPGTAPPAPLATVDERRDAYPAAVKRPNPALWLYYQYEGKLPETYRDWVLHDATCTTWLLRVVLRGLVQILPFVAILLGMLIHFGGALVPALGAGLLGVLVVVRTALTSSVESVDGRLAAYGFPAVRARQTAEAAERYRPTWRREQSDHDAAPAGR